MNIIDLEEAQELTSQAVREYLERKGWKRMPAQDAKRAGECWVLRGGAGGTVWVAEGRPSVTVERLCALENRTPQAILREINPRLRKGVPSRAARTHHCGPWIAFDDKGSPCVGFWTVKDGMDPNSFYLHKHGHVPAARVAEWSFWPADMQLNRIPWPRGADGREL